MEWLRAFNRLSLVPRNSLTRRWLTRVFVVIVAFLMVLQVLFTLMLRYYYYVGVENALDSRARLYQRTMEMSAADEAASWSTGSRELIAYFSDKDKMELQVLDSYGHISLSSTGFVPTEATAVPLDFKRALDSDAGQSVWRGTIGREQVMTLTVLQRDTAGELVGALRYVVSLSMVNRQVTLLALSVFGFILLIIFFVFLSGMFFIRSVINPVDALGHTTRRIALGEYDVRVEKHRDDEIGRLCDSINFMASEIGATERLKNEFISSVSHELRTPLTAIKGWSETLQATPDDRELVSQGLSVIGNEATRLSGLVEELLDFSRMESGHITLCEEPVNMATVLEEAVFLYRDRAARAGIVLDYSAAAELPSVRGDAARLKQVLINILDNAVKYSHNGDRVWVEATAQADSVRVVIRDTGIGIDTEQLKLVRRKFYQTNATNPGSGIGLAMADEIVRLHGGRLELQSELSVGTTVTVTLPLAAQEKGSSI